MATPEEVTLDAILTIAAKMRDRQKLCQDRLDRARIALQSALVAMGEHEGCERCWAARDRVRNVLSDIYS